jgi:hypothetical protein
MLGSIRNTDNLTEEYQEIVNLARDVRKAY